MKKILSLLFATTLLVSCASEETSAPCNELRVTVGVNGGVEVPTKGFVGSSGTTGSGYTNLNTGGAIGLFVKGTGYAATPTPTVATWVSGTPNKWTITAPIYLSGNAATVYAYYPSTLAPSPSTFLAPLGVTLIPSTGQSITGDTSQADFLYQPDTTPTRPTVKNTDVAGATAAITLNHAMVKLSFIVNLATTYPYVTTPACSGVAISTGTPAIKKPLTTTGSSGATMNVTTGVFAGLQAVSSISFSGSVAVNTSSTSTNKIFSVLVAPITGPFNLGDLDINMTIDTKNYSGDLPAISATGGWVAGNEYTYTITVTPTALVVGSSVTVTDWGTGTGGTVAYQ